MSKEYRPLDTSGLKTYSLGDRSSLVDLQVMAAVPSPGASFQDFLAGLPDALAARDLRAVAGAVVASRMNGRPVILGMGAHVIKCGLSPVVISLMERGAVTALAMNGACLVHDVELALAGRTSEDVASALTDGSFGMARETAELANGAATRKEATDGLGHAAGLALAEAGARGGAEHLDKSLLAAASRLGLPATVHVAIGTDITHMHPNFDAAAMGRASEVDFRLLAAVVADLSGGVYLNVGSAVVLPEVFLKCLSMARNLGHDVRGFTTVNMDFVQHYRPVTNVVRRPTSDQESAGIAITGHHEIMLPLLAQAIVEQL